MCDFCADRATYRYLTRDEVTHGPETVRFCRFHLLLYYLAIGMSE